MRDGTGTVGWAGELRPGEERTLRATPPVRVRADDAGAVAVSLDGEEQGAVGRLGEPGRRTFAAGSSLR